MPVLQFKGKSAVETYDRIVPHRVLEIDEKLSLAKKPSLSGNLIVEGDNLLALKSLLPTHAGLVNCIYIDPPYNTGNEGWVYNDNLSGVQFKEWIGKAVGKEGEDATRHDKWCCMMYPRLQLMRELLADNGKILVSIDDNEAASLKLMMDEVFGSENFLSTIIWKTRNTDNRVKTMLSVDHEYVFVYSKKKSPLRGRVIDRSDFIKDDNDGRGLYVTDPLTGKATKKERPQLHFVIINDETKDRYEPDPARGWITDRAGIEVLKAEGKMAWPPDPRTGKPRKKRYLSETSERMPASSFWADLRGESGADEVDRILGRRLFAFPKSVEFMTAILDLAVGPEDLVLDPTAGSGTTAHAILAQNKKDGGKRRFVTIQMPHDSKENETDGLNIAKTITRERVARVISGYETKDDEGKKSKISGLGGDFTYVRVGRTLFDDYRNLGAEPPSWSEMARYVWFTETSHPLDPARVDEKTGKIGEWKGVSYYLLYSGSTKEARALDREFLRGLKDKNRKVIYAEKIWIHRDELKEFGDVRPMLVPYNLK